MRQLRKAFWGLLLSVVSMAPLAVRAQQEEAKPADASANLVFRFSFEKDVQRWQGVGTNPTVVHTAEPANVHSGAGALHFGYRIQDAEKAGAIVLLRPAALAKMKSMRFWVKPDHSGTLALVLQEQGGGRYIAFFYARGEQWNEVALTPSDFILSVGEGDPKDPNGKLDVEQVESIAIADFTQWLVGQGGAQIEQLFPVAKGSHNLYLDDLVVTSDPLPDTREKKDKETLLDTFARPQLFWMPMGKVALSLHEGKPLTGKSLKMEYQYSPTEFLAVGRNLPSSPFVKMGSIAFTATSQKPTRMIVQLEEKKGAKYYASLNIPGDMDTREYALNFKEFQPAVDSKQPKKPIEPEQISVIFFMDVTGVQDKVTQANILWLNNLRAIAP